MIAAAPPTPQRLFARRGYVVLAVFLASWMAMWLVVAATEVAKLYYYSYYSVDYRKGFVRRGLAGELLDLFPRDRYFSGLEILRWAPTAFYSIALAAVAATVAVRFGRSERRLMLAVLPAVLPFGILFGLLSARTDLYGGAALAVFAVVAATARDSRALMTASAVYGVALVPFTLMHEATPFLYGLGAIATVIAFGRCYPTRIQTLCTLLAVVPGIGAGLLVARLGRRGISAQLGELVPHGPVNNPWAGKPTIGQLLTGFHFDVDYHDWFCRFVVPYFDQSFGDAERFVLSRGPGPLGLSVLLGVVCIAVTALAIDRVSGTPARHFAGVLAERGWWLLAGAALIVPVFVTGVDWTRWCVTIGYDLGIPYLLYAAGRDEAALPVTRAMRVGFAVGVLGMALFPIGLIPGFAGAFTA